MNIEKICKKVINLCGAEIGLLELFLLKQPENYSYKIACKLFTNYTIDDLKLYFSEYIDKFKDIIIVKEEYSQKIYILEFSIDYKIDERLCYVIDSEHSLGNFRNNKHIAIYLCNLFEIRNMLCINDGLSRA